MNMKTILLFLMLSIISTRCYENLSYEPTNKFDPESADYIPAAPGFFRADSVKEFFVALSWRDMSLGEEGFIIERKNHNVSGFNPIVTLGTGVTQYRDEFTLESGKNYYYRICSFKGLNKSNYLDTISVKLITPDISNIKVPITY